MGKRIHEWQCQRCVAVAYGVVWCLLLCVIALFVWKTHIVISGRLLEQNAELLGNMYYALFGFPGIITFIGAWRKCDGWRAVLTMRLILILVIVAVFWPVFTSSSEGMAFYIGVNKPEPGLVSAYEVLFIYLLFVVCASFQCWLIACERVQNELNSVVGGVLVIMGILMPKLLESYSILSAHCSKGGCASSDVDGLALFEMGIACAAALAVMFVVGLFSRRIVQFLRLSEQEVSLEFKGSSLANSQNAEVPVSEREIATASDKQKKESEELPASSSVATRLSQEAADGVVPRVCSEETSAQPTVSLASSSVSRGDNEGLTRSMESVMGSVGVSVLVESSSGSGSVAVSKQLMSAAVSGVVAGVCFSVATRLFNRR